jgi:4-amino-4-deoxy-L-arabinose transferase-like glycosyltransferase
MRRFWKEYKKEILAGVGLLLLAFFLRVHNLTKLPVFGDEAIYIRWSQVMRAEPSLRFLPLTDGKQPLFMWLVIPFLKVISDPLIAGRAVSVIAGVGTLAGIFVLTKVLFRSIKLSLIASLLYTISPFSVFFDRLALADSLLSFFGVWAFVFSLLTARKVRLDTAMLAGFCLGGALLTKSPAIFFSALIPTSLLLHEWPKKAKERFNRLSVFVFLFTFTYAIGYGMYNILRLGENFHMIGLRNKDYVYSLSHLLQSPFDPLRPYLDRSLEYFWILGPAVLIVLIIIGFYIGLKEKRKETLVVIAWGILPILAVAEFSKTMTARYIYFSVPYFFVLASLVFLKEKFSLMKLMKVVFIVFVMHALFVDSQLLTKPQNANLPRSERSGYLEEWTAGYGIKEVSDFIKNEYMKNSSQKIVVGTEGFFGTLPDGLQFYLNDYRDITVIGVGQPIKDLPQSLTDSRKAGNKTYLVINSTRFLSDAETQNLKLLSSYDKAMRPDGSKESLLFFELK